MGQNMQEAEQLTFDFGIAAPASLDKQDESNTSTHAQSCVFDFNKLFTNGVGAEEVHSHNSMVILGDSLQVLKGMKEKSVHLASYCNILTRR